VGRKVATREDTHENQVQQLRARIVELRETIPLYAGTTSEAFIREHIQQLQHRIQHLLQEAAANRSAARFGASVDFQEG
jgi:hypothetical protein